MNEQQKKLVKLGAGILLAILLLVGLRVTSIRQIPANTVGVKYSAISGVQDKTLKSGYHLITPFVDKIYKLSTEVQTTELKDISTQTKDSQYTKTDLNVKWRVSEKNAMTVFKNFRDIERLQNQGIAPEVQKSLEEVSVEFDIVGILGSERNKLYKEFEANLTKRFEKYGVDLVSVTLVDTDAGESIENAIAAEAVKQKEVATAKQEQEKARVEAETKKVQAQAEADSEVIKAQGQAKANSELSNSITDNLIRMKEAEARMEHGWVEVQTSGQAIVDAGK